MWRLTKLCGSATRWMRACWARRWVTCVNSRKQQQRQQQQSKVLSLKAQVTNHTQSAACPNSSVAVLFDGPLQKFLLCDRPLPAWRSIIAGETISLKQKPVHFRCGALRDLRHPDLMFTVICATTLQSLSANEATLLPVCRLKLWNENTTNHRDTVGRCRAENVRKLEWLHHFCWQTQKEDLLWKGKVKLEEPEHTAKLNKTRSFHSICMDVYQCEWLQKHRWIFTILDITQHNARPNAMPEQGAPAEVWKTAVAGQRRGLKGSSVCGDSVAPFKPSYRAAAQQGSVSVAMIWHHALHVMLDDASTLALLRQQPVRWVSIVAQFEQEPHSIWTLAKNSPDTWP